MEIDVPGFDKIAREVFAPIYPVIAEQIKHKAGITRGTCLDIGGGGGGGFGTSELKTQIFCEMNKRDSEWRKKNQNHTSDESLEKLKQSLGQAQIPSFEIDRYEAGMWMIIRKEACHEM